MDSSERQLLSSLLRETRVLSVGLLIDGAPHVGVMPFLATPDFGALVVHGSRMARHSRGIVPGAPFAAAIHRPDGPEHDPLALPRLLVEGQIEAVTESEAEELTTVWVERFASAAMTVQLGDFAFHRLRIESGRLVAGFGRAFTVIPSALAEAAQPTADN